MNAINSAGMYATSAMATIAPTSPTYPLRSCSHGSDSQTDPESQAMPNTTEIQNLAATERYHFAFGLAAPGLRVGRRSGFCSRSRSTC